ncbi:hypothetical protein [Mycolicibacterium llatzerense]|uniref:hypothetical protein n=1 Tax=Mycolicibacterium llatzerense TaxID=280871 RepID=UPI0021B5C591|nr:hypothetical protein [Mycolicibacterium llatzerense]
MQIALGVIAPALVCQSVVPAAVGESRAAANPVGHPAAVGGAARSGLSGGQELLYRRAQHHRGHQSLASAAAETSITSSTSWTVIVRPHQSPDIQYTPAATTLSTPERLARTQVPA